MQHSITVKLESTRAVQNAKKLENQLDRTERRASKIGATFGRVTGLVAGLATSVALLDFGRTIVETERQKAALETMTGSMDRANQAYKELNEFASKTPFTIDQSVDAFVKMKALGLNPTESALMSFANTASASGKSLTDVVEAVADATTFQFERLREAFNITSKTIGDNIEFTFQGVTTTVKKESAEIANYLQSIGDVGGAYFGAASKQMERLPGLISNLRDKVQNLWRTLGDAGGIDLFGRAIKWAIELLDDLNWALESGFLSETLQARARAFSEPFVESFKIISGAWHDMIGDMEVEWFDFETSTSPDGDSFFQRWLDAIALLPAAWQSVVEIILTKFLGAMQIIGNGAKILYLDMKKWFLFIGETAAMLWSDMQSGFGAVIDWIAEKLAAVLERISVSLSGIPGMDALSEKLKVAADGLRDMATNVDAVEAAERKRLATFDASIAAIDKEIMRLKEHNVVIDQERQGIVQAEAEKLLAKKAALETERERIQVDIERREAADILNESERILADTVGDLKVETAELVDSWEDGSKEADKFEDELNDLLNKLDPAREKTQQLSAANALLMEAYGRGYIPTIQEVIYWQDQFAKSLDDTVTASESMEAAMKAGIERVDNAISSAWQDILSSGTFAFDSIANAFDSMLSEMIHNGLTRKVKIYIQEQVDDAGPAGALGVAAGGIGGKLIGGGGTGAGIGSGVGSIAGLILSGGNPVGAFVGGLIGGILGGLFDKDPRLEVGGSKFDKDARYHDTALGGVYVDSRKMGDALPEYIKAIEEFDASLAGLLSEEQLEEASSRLASWYKRMDDEAINIEDLLESRFNVVLGVFDKFTQAFVRKGGDLEEQFTRLQVALSVDKMITELPDTFEGRTQADVLAVIDAMNTAGESMAATFERFVERMDVAIGAVATIEEYISSDLAQAFQDVVDREGMSMIDMLNETAAAIGDLRDNFGGTAEGANTVAIALVERYNMELAFLGRIRDALAEIGQITGNAIETIQASQRTDAEQIEFLLTQRDALFATLPGLEDPEAIRDAVAEITRMTMEAFGLMDEEGQAAAADAFVTFLEGVQTAAEAQLNSLEQAVLDDSESLRAQMADFFDTLGDPLELVANEFDGAAEALRDSAAALLGVADALNPPVPPGGGGFPLVPGVYNPYTPAQFQAAITTGMSNGSAPLVQAAAEYATAGATQARALGGAAIALAGAVTSIPNRIVVEVVASEF